MDIKDFRNFVEIIRVKCNSNDAIVILRLAQVFEENAKLKEKLANSVNNGPTHFIICDKNAKPISLEKIMKTLEENIEKMGSGVDKKLQVLKQFAIDFNLELRSAKNIIDFYYPYYSDKLFKD